MRNPKFYAKLHIAFSSINAKKSRNFRFKTCKNYVYIDVSQMYLAPSSSKVSL